MNLFSPLDLRDVRLRNRVVVSPMCQYSSDDGFASDWHLVQLGGFAVGGASVVFTEANAVTPEGRISPWDLGIWKDEHVPMLRRITTFIEKEGALAGTQLAHAGRKASVDTPWRGGKLLSEIEGGWRPVLGPSAIPFADRYATPNAMTTGDIASAVVSFREAARRALDAGFHIVELHAAHGYLMHEFLSPASNARTDAYGGSLDNRLRFTLEVVDAVREVWPERLPLWVRISATDWTEGAWHLEDSIELARRLKARGVDLVDCSTGGNVHGAKIPVAPGYQVPFAERVRREAGIATGAVGLITESAHANEIIERGQADVVLLARELLRNPHWPLRAAKELGVDIKWPVQHERAKQ